MRIVMETTINAKPAISHGTKCRHQGSAVGRAAGCVGDEETAGISGSTVPASATRSVGGEMSGNAAGVLVAIEGVSGSDDAAIGGCADPAIAATSCTLIGAVSSAGDILVSPTVTIPVRIA